MFPQTLTGIIDHLQELGEGELTLSNGKSIWQFHLADGQLIYPVNVFHRIRRWDRAIREQQLNWHWQCANERLVASSLWELQLFEQGFAQQQLSPRQAKLIIRSVVQECLFELNCKGELQSEWQPMPKPLCASGKTALLSAKELQMLGHKAANMQQAWQFANFGELNPNLAPVLTQTPSLEALPVNPRYLTGQFNLWDISLQVGKPLTWVARSLLALADSHYLHFKPLSDLSSSIAAPISQSLVSSPLVTSETVPSKHLSADQTQTRIACIDDSPVLAHSLRKRLESAGYEMMSIQEPMRECSRLVEYKPDLILLALNLPNDGGYSICKFLRATPVFKTTPIVILTGRDTCIDRLKAKTAGATVFLTKPPQSQELLSAIQRFSAPKPPLLLSAA